MEIDRGDDGSTVMLGRSPLLEDPRSDPDGAGAPDLPASAAGSAPGVAEIRLDGRCVSWIVAVVIGLAFAAVNHLQPEAGRAERLRPPSPRRGHAPAERAAHARTHPTPTPPPSAGPRDRCSVSTDIDASVSIDGRVVRSSGFGLAPVRRGVGRAHRAFPRGRQADRCGGPGTGHRADGGPSSGQAPAPAAAVSRRVADTALEAPAEAVRRLASRNSLSNNPCAIARSRPSR